MKTEQFSMRLTTAEDARLKRLAKFYGVTKADVIRMLMKLAEAKGWELTR